MKEAAFEFRIYASHFVDVLYKLRWELTAIDDMRFGRDGSCGNQREQ